MQIKLNVKDAGKTLSKFFFEIFLDISASQPRHEGLKESNSVHLQESRLIYFMLISRCLATEQSAVWRRRCSGYPGGCRGRAWPAGRGAGGWRSTNRSAVASERRRARYAPPHGYSVTTVIL